MISYWCIDISAWRGPKEETERERIRKDDRKIMGAVERDRERDKLGQRRS